MVGDLPHSHTVVKARELIARVPDSKGVVTFVVESYGRMVIGTV